MHLFLHIGSQKCGSTSIQNSLRINRERLVSRGIIQPEGISLEGNCWVGVGAFKAPGKWGFPIRRREILQSSQSDLLQRFSRSIAEAKKKHPHAHSMIISSEFFLPAYHADPESINRLRDYLSERFTSVSIIFYGRPQRELAPSHYAQTVKGWGASTGSFQHFLNSLEKEHGWYDFNSTLSYWSNSFGAPNIHVGIISEGKIGATSLIHDFFQKCRLSNSEISTLKDPRRNRNVSPGYTGIQFLRFVNFLRLAPCLDWRISRSWDLFENLAAKLPGRRFPCGFEKSLSTRFAKSNLELISRFSATPETDPSNLLALRT